MAHVLIGEPASIAPGHALLDSLPMRIALMTDVHGNREAFAACLAHAAQNGIDRYVFLGDFAGYGADPGWVIDTVRAHVERGAVALLGNHDAAVLVDDNHMNETADAAI